MRAVAAALLCLAAVALGGCGTSGLTTDAADTSEGKALFREKCGGCHTLREAGTRGVQGPNLDYAFSEARRENFDEGTIREVVRHQIEYPAPPMPADLVEGAEADAVAAYVAEVASNPEAQVAAPSSGRDANDPQALFQGNCGSCHTLADAGTSGTTGPNLDQAKPNFRNAYGQIKNGGGGMPPFGAQLSDEQIRALARYIVRVTGG